MFEYDNKDEARVEFEKADERKVLSEIIHYKDFEKSGKLKRWSQKSSLEMLR